MLLLCDASACAADLALLGVVRFSGLVFLINRVIRLSAFLLLIYENQLRLAFQSKKIWFVIFLHITVQKKVL